MDGSFHAFLERRTLLESSDRWGDRDYVPIHQRSVYRAGVMQGKRAEAGMLATLKSMGYDTYPSSDAEDMNLGIDGYIRIGERYFSVQLKRRTTTDDLAFELSMDRRANDPHHQPEPMVFLDNINGKDAKWEADLYVVANTSGQLYMVQSRHAHMLIDQAIRNWKSMLSRPQVARYNSFLHGSSGARPTLQDHFVKLKINWDPEKHVWKMMAYIKIETIGQPIQPVESAGMFSKNSSTRA